MTPIETFFAELTKPKSGKPILNPKGDAKQNTTELLSVADEVWNLATIIPATNLSQVSSAAKPGEYEPIKPGCLNKDGKLIEYNGGYIINPTHISTAVTDETLPDGKTIKRPIIDLVQQGGAMFGIGLVGYTYIMEKAGLRFYSLGGTSAGGINTVLLGAIPNTIYRQQSVFKPQSQATKSEILAHVIANTDFAQFMERKGIVGYLQKMVFRKFSPKSFSFFVVAITLLISGVAYNRIGKFFTSDNGLSDSQIGYYDFVIGFCVVLMPFLLYYTILVLIIGRKFGLNTGINFYNWVKSILETDFIKVKTVKDLTTRLNETEFDLKSNNENPRLVLISSNLTHNRIVKFPERGDQYFNYPDLVTPAAYLRATMSIPFIYETFIPDANHVLGSPADSVKMHARFVDGGMLSNFPIREFHSINTPRFPTFGVLLSENPLLKDTTDKEPPTMPFISLFSYIMSFISTFRNFYDNDFLTSDNEIRLRIETVDTNKFNYLDFWMENEQKKALFKAGAEAAVRQLEKFEWGKYLETRNNNGKN